MVVPTPGPVHTTPAFLASDQPTPPAAPEGVSLHERRAREAALAELVRLSEEMGIYDR